MSRELFDFATWRIAALVLPVSAILLGCNKPVETPVKESVPVPAPAPISTTATPSKPTPPPIETPVKRQPARLNDLVGVWNWGWALNETKPPVMRTTVTFNADGTASQAKTGKKGTWELADSELKVDWADGSWNRMTLSPDGTTMDGKNHQGLHCIAKKRK